MKRALLLVAIAGCAAGKQAPQERYISIDADAIATARAVAGARMHLLETNGEIAVIAIDDADLGALSDQMHEQHQRCGGFMLHESLADARAALVPPTDRRPIDYTLDRAAAVRAVLPALDAKVIARTIGELSAMKSRHFQSESGAAASLWLRDRWASLTSRSDVTLELVDHGFAQKSVVMTIPGSTLASEVVVLGGHLDSITMRDRVGGGAAPGADDDASGIATLTEVARVLLASDYRPARTIKLIAYAGEEVGLRGSQAIVRDFMKRKINVVGVLQLDMTNYQGSDKDIWLMKDFTNPAQNAFLIQLIETYTGATWGLDACGYACSDHASWYRAGIPASMPFESRMRQRNRWIHSADDTLEVSGNNAAHAVKFARLAAAYAIELGKGELAPNAPIAPTHRAPLWPWLAVLGGAALWIGRVRSATRA